MENQEEEKNVNEGEISLLNKKRKNSNKKSKKEKKNIENLSKETILEIKKIKKELIESEIENINEELNEKENIINNNKIDEETILLMKKTLINFNTDEGKFHKGRLNHKNFSEEEKLNSYFVQRYYFFSLFDKGIQMDKESWYSVTPEEISEYISSIIPDSKNSSILDGFCGCGGNIIYFSKYFKKVIANDLFETKINMTKNNTKVYECPDNIEYYNKDYFDLDLGNEKIDYVFLSPPWGGPEYKKDKIYSLKKWVTPDIEKILKKSLNFSKNLILYLPRNTDLDELANLLNLYDKETIESFSNTILFDVKYLNSASKIKAILVLYGPKFNTMKVKLIREYLINSVFRKNSNKINETKVKKQINILKVIGYSEYVSHFIRYKDIKKDSSGNSFLEILEKYFLENVMDEEQIKEYEKLCKLKNIKGDEENHNNVEEKELQAESEDNKDDNKKMELENNNELIDLREILSEEQFNKAKKDNFFDC